ncbi:MAG: hypothetical protein WBE89_06140, partial [Methyloceanibacter sp.]
MSLPCHGLSDTFRSHEPCRHRAGCKHCTLASANGSIDAELAATPGYLQWHAEDLLDKALRKK